VNVCPSPLLLLLWNSYYVFSLSVQETETAEFEQRKRERDEASEAKTAKNRAKRQKKKASRAAAKKGDRESSDEGVTREQALSNEDGSATVFKKRRLIGGDGQAMIFRGPGEEQEYYEGMMPSVQEALGPEASAPESTDAKPIEPGLITIVDED